VDVAVFMFAQDARPDGLLGLLSPLWQLVIGVFVVVAVLAAGARLARRGRSRMNAALLYIAAAIIAVTVLGVLIAAR